MIGFGRTNGWIEEMGKKIKIGYFVPEFPAQTHAFFWREIQALKEIGISVDLISTKKPPQKLISHEWAELAMEQTTYLFPPQVTLFFKALFIFVIAGFKKWRQVILTVLRAETNGIKERIRHMALAVWGVILAQRSKDAGWRHVHVHSCADSANIAMYSHIITGLTYSLTLHGPLDYYGLNQNEKWKHCSFGIGVTNALLEELKDKLKTDLPNVLKKAPMGVDTGAFSRTKPYVPWKSGVCRLFSCARLNEGKRHDDVIEAVSQLNQNGIPTVLRIAGEDDSSTGQIRKQLTELIRKYGLEENVFLLGAISEAAVKKELLDAHFFVLGSSYEAIGVATMEAMAMGVPVIVTDVGGVSELVRDGIDGAMVEPGHPEQISSAIMTLLKAPERALMLSIAGRERIGALFCSNISANIIADCLREIEI